LNFLALFSSFFLIFDNDDLSNDYFRYQIGWLIEVKYYPHRTLLRDVFEVTRNWVDFIREDVGKNAILAVQTAR
jgi:hypothetical protein